MDEDTQLNLWQKTIAERVGELLAQSPMREDFKEEVLERLDSLPDYQAVQLLDALEAEQGSLEDLVYELRQYEEDRTDAWKKIQEDQRAAGDKLVDDYVKTIQDDFAAQQ